MYNENRYYYQRNILGDITHIYSEDGVLVAKYVYDGYGRHKVLNSLNEEDTNLYSIGNLNPFRYRGYYYDRVLGLYNLVSRYYDPEVCRFISPDTISILDKTKLDINGLNLYMYCNDNPIMFVDPSGYIVVSTLVIGGLILAGSFVLGFGISVGSQWISYGKNSINFLQATIDGSIALITTALSFTGIPTWGMGLIGAVTSFGQYVMDVRFHEQELNGQV